MMHLQVQDFVLNMIQSDTLATFYLLIWGICCPWDGVRSRTSQTCWNRLFSKSSTGGKCAPCAPMLSYSGWVISVSLIAVPSKSVVCPQRGNAGGRKSLRKWGEGVKGPEAYWGYGTSLAISGSLGLVNAKCAACKSMYVIDLDVWRREQAL